ncbi:MAG: TIGR04141 family sporadically distributed protein [Streptosporangiaceae bacterium]
MVRPRTRIATLYRLPSVSPTAEAMFEALDAEKLDEIRADPQPTEIATAPALWVGGQFTREVAGWCGDASTTTGIDVSYGDSRSAGLILVAVDGTTYALGYGDGHRLIPDELKDQRFGLRFAVRCLDPEQIQDLVRRMLASRGRTDTTMAPAGLPIWTLDVEQHADIIRRIGGRLTDLDLTYSSEDDRAVPVDGAAGVRMRLGVEPDELVRDIRTIAGVCERAAPHPDLEFVEYILPVGDAELSARLDADLDAVLGDPGVPACLAPVVPTSLVGDFGVARSFTIRIGGASPRRVDPLELAEFLHRTRRQRPGMRVQALRNGRVEMYANETERDPLGGARAIKWLEANLSRGSSRFFLLDGEWYEIGAEYVRAMRDEIVGLFGVGPSLDLPTWDMRRDRYEEDYNAFVPGARPAFVCLDRKKVRNPLGRTSGVEICDLLGPDDELIHVKRAERSAPLSHLFAQGLVSAQTLINSSDARARFVDRVRDEGKGRVVPPDFVPKKVVFAILLKGGEQLTPDTLFPFSQATLAQTARILRSYQIAVEVMGIRASTE